MIYEYCLWDIMIAVAYTSVLWVIVFIILICFLFKKRNKKYNRDEYEKMKKPPKERSFKYTLGGHPIYNNSIWIDTWYNTLYKIENVTSFARSGNKQDVYIIYRELAGNTELDLKIKNLNTLEDQSHTWIPTNKYKD